MAGQSWPLSPAAQPEPCGWSKALVLTAALGPFPQVAEVLQALPVRPSWCSQVPSEFPWGNSIRRKLGKEGHADLKSLWF